MVGIDYSTHSVDLVSVELEGGRAVWAHAALAGDDAFDRLRSVAGAMPRASAWDDTLAVGIEEPQGVSQGTRAKLKAVQGAIVACLPSRLLVHPFGPSEWRRLVGLPGSATKAGIALFVHDDLRASPHWPQDACDAFCLALAVRERLEGVAV